MSKIIKCGSKQFAAVILTVSCLAFPALSNAQGGLLEEIVVTASKRATTLQEVPIAVSVVSGDSIEKAEILDLKDLQSLVPSLRINQLQNSSNTNFIIRGFGNGANNPGIEPSVGVFIDGVYRSRSAAQISDLPNLERVEVLRGPQSTLFGKNASAGVISVVTRAPTGESAAKLSVTAGSFNQLTVKAQAEGALAENIAFDISAGSNTRDGYVDNLVTGSEINSRDRQSVRGQLVFTPGDSTQIRVIADYDKIDEECCAVNNFFQSPLEVFVNSQTGAVVKPNSPFSTEVFYDLDPINQIDNSGISIQVDHDYDNFSLTSITALRNVDSFSNIDADFVSKNYITNPITTEIDTFTQEIRLTSTGDGDVDWMVGGFFFDEKIDYINDLPYGPGFRPFVDALSLASGAPNALAGVEQALGLPVFTTFFPANGAVTENATLDNQAISIFSQLDWHIGDRLTATVGLNYTKDEKQSTLEQVNVDAFSGVDFVQVGAAGIFAQLTGLAPTPANIGANLAAFGTALGLATNPAINSLLGLQALQFLDPVQTYPNAVEDGETDDDELTYTLRLAYDLSDSVNIYGGISTGFKASSVNLSRNAHPNAADSAALQSAGLRVSNPIVGTRFAAPENSTVVEVGLKATFDRGSLNLAIFDQKIEDFQSNVFIGDGFTLSNAEEQSTTGLEFDLTYFPVDALKLTFAGTLLDPVYDSFTQSAQGDLSGQKPAGIHETSLSIGGTYSFQMGSMDAYISGDYQFDDEVQTNDGIPPEISSEENKNLNLSAGVTTENGLRMSVWGRNVTDHETVTTAFPTVGGTMGIFGYRNQPRTYGVTISKDF